MRKTTAPRKKIGNFLGFLFDFSVLYNIFIIYLARIFAFLLKRDANGYPAPFLGEETAIDDGGGLKIRRSFFRKKKDRTRGL